MAYSPGITTISTSLQVVWFGCLQDGTLFAEAQEIVRSEAIGGNHAINAGLSGRALGYAP